MKIHNPLLLLLLATGADAAPTELARLLTADGAEVCCEAVSGRTIVAGGLLQGQHLGERAHVFVEPEGGWAGDVVASATLRISDGAHFSFVAISGDTVVASARRVDGQGISLPGTGAAYVFVKPPGGWSGELTEAAKLTASDAAACFLCDEVFFFGDVIVQNDVIVVGAANAEVEPGKHGAAYVFLRPRHGWAGELHEQAKLRPRNPEASSFEDGSFFDDLAISGDAIFAAADHEENESGSVYVFTKPPAGWHGLIFEQARLRSPEPNGDDGRFGKTIDAWGDTLVVGSWTPAAAYVFVEPAGGWARASHEQAALIPSGGVLADAVAIDRDISVTAEFRLDPLSAFVEPPGGWAGVLAEPDTVLSGGPPLINSRIALYGDTLIGGSRVFRLGLDADDDGLSDAMETELGTDPLDEDGDGDEIPDGQDPDLAAALVVGLDDASFAHRGSRRGLLVLLRNAERCIAAGDPARALRGLAQVRSRMDGCEPAADRNDRIVDCAAQRELRERLDVLAENLGR